MSEPLFTGKVALVTGGAGDLGNEMALHLAQQGASIVIWDIKPYDQAQSRIERVNAAGRPVMYQQVNIADRSAVDAALVEVVAKLGVPDIVCANAGVVDAKPILEVSQQNWNYHIDNNLTGSFNVSQAAAQRMVASGKQGRIIFTTSWVSEIPWPEDGPYSVSKAGINMLMKSMARELARYGIRVNAVSPGIVKAGLAGRQLIEEPEYARRVSKVIPLGEPGTPVEVAEAVVYLASPQAAYMTGSILTIDGGCSLFQFDQ